MVSTPLQGASSPASWRSFGVFCAILTACFSVVLWRLFLLSRAESLHSHVLLIPAISLYFGWLRREALPRQSTSSRAGAAVFAGLGAAALIAHVLLVSSGRVLARPDSLALLTFGYVALVTAGGLVFLGREWMKALWFPFFFLIFMIPLPGAVVNGVEWFLQHGSAEFTAVIFQITGTPTFRDGLVFKLPGITLQVAQECSGIRSSYVLFITCLAAGHLLLNRGWSRLTLALVVIPLGLLRNAVRIFVIAQLCISQGPHMIDSRIHREGGPLFFAVALIPLFLILFMLRKAEGSGLRPRSVLAVTVPSKRPPAGPASASSGPAAEQSLDQGSA